VQVMRGFFDVEVLVLARSAFGACSGRPSDS
jgi:hypothetical protein